MNVYYQAHKAEFAAYHQAHKEYRAAYRKEHKAEIDARNIKYRESHKAEKAEADRRYREEHKAELAEKKRQYRQNNKDKVTAHRKEYYENNKEVIQEKNRQWFADNPEKERAIKQRYVQAHPDRVKAKAKMDFQRRYGTAKGKLTTIVSAGVIGSLRNGSKAGRRWESLVGFTVDQLRAHLEKQFDSNMSWGNQGSYWHIDHKIPISAFNFETPDDLDFKRCWSLKNLQPLEAKKNISKGGRVDRPFQPALAIAI